MPVVPPRRERRRSARMVRSKRGASAASTRSPLDGDPPRHRRASRSVPHDGDDPRLRRAHPQGPRRGRVRLQLLARRGPGGNLGRRGPLPRDDGSAGDHLSLRRRCNRQGRSPARAGRGAPGEERWDFGREGRRHGDPLAGRGTRGQHRDRRRGRADRQRSGPRRETPRNRRRDRGLVRRRRHQHRRRSRGDEPGRGLEPPRRVPVSEQPLRRRHAGRDVHAIEALLRPGRRLRHARRHRRRHGPAGCLRGRARGCPARALRGRPELPRGSGAPPPRPLLRRRHALCRRRALGQGARERARGPLPRRARGRRRAPGAGARPDRRRGRRRGRRCACVRREE